LPTELSDFLTLFIKNKITFLLDIDQNAMATLKDRREAALFYTFAKKIEFQYFQL